MSLISLDRVSLSFATRDSEVSALEDISLSVEAGEFVCIVGPSGSGKTTLLRLIAGFLQPSEGELLFAGEPVTEPGWERGMVFQSASLYPWLTVYRNVEFGPRVRGIASAQRRESVERYLRLVKLWDVRDRRPFELSGGMRQRVAIARVLANDPHVLLMDEPFGALDALTREHLQEELRGLWRSTGKTVVFVTHSVEEAVFLSTKIVVLSARPGRLITEVDVPFSRRSESAVGERQGRAIKSEPRFVALREQVLEYIWTAG
jgi:ABC-type taurine transport system ATPase subunit